MQALNLHDFHPCLSAEQPAGQKQTAGWVDGCSCWKCRNRVVLDYPGLHRIGLPQQWDLIELVDDRYSVRSTIAISQYPLDQWHETMEDPTLTDALLDRLVNNAHKIQLTGESIRKVNGQQE